MYINVYKCIILNNQKTLDKVDISLNCSNYFCEEGKIEANIADEKNILDKAIDIKIIKQDSANIVIKGKISNLGYLAEALNISDKIGDGSIVIDIAGNGQGLNPNFKGNINLDKSITFYESKQIKDLTKDGLFSKIKDKIFANNKVIVAAFFGHFKTFNMTHCTSYSTVHHLYSIKSLKIS